MNNVYCIFTKKLINSRTRRVKLTFAEQQFYEVLIKYGFEHNDAVLKVLANRASRLEKLLKI